MTKKIKEQAAQAPEEVAVFDIGAEFRVTDDMENGVKIQLSKDAYIVIRYAFAKAFIKGSKKILDENQEASQTDNVIRSIAEFGIVDIKNVSVPGFGMIENTPESKLAALKWKGENHDEPPFLDYVFRQMRNLGNFPGAGSSLLKV